MLKLCGALLLLACSLVDSSTTREYEVSLEISQDSDEEIYLQISGTKSQTEYMFVGNDDFFANVPKVVSLYSAVDVGTVNEVRVKAYKSGDPNHLPYNVTFDPIDFITVKQHKDDGSVVVTQFDTDYFTQDGQPHMDLEHGSTGATFYFDMVYVASENSGAPKLEYAVQVQTGNGLTDGCAHSVEIQFNGDAGTSAFYSLGSNFEPGQLIDTAIQITEVIGDLQSITLRATHTDDWVPRGFVNVATFRESNSMINGQSIQFDTGFILAMDGADDSVEKITLSAVNPEQIAARVATEYKIEATFQTVPQIEIYVQIQGSKRNSNFFKLDTDEVRAGSPALWGLAVPQELGEVIDIAIYPGGAYGGGSAASATNLVLLDSMYVYSNHRPTASFYMHDDMAGGRSLTKHQVTTLQNLVILRPIMCDASRNTKCCGNSYCESGETTSNCAADCLQTNMWGTAPTSSDVSPPSSVPTAPTVVFDAEKLTNPTVAAVSDAVPTIVTPIEVNDPRDDCAFDGVPTGTLLNGQVSNNTGADYCNLCRCEWGYLNCTKHDCSRPHNLPAGATPCKTVDCVYNAATSRVQVLHDHAEDVGDNHACRYNLHTNQCNCWCYGDEPHDEYVKDLLTGTHSFGKESQTPESDCTLVPFETSFNPKGALPKAIVTLAADLSSEDHCLDGSCNVVDSANAQASSLWVQTMQYDNMLVCGSHEPHAVIQYMVWQDAGEDKPFNGAMSGQEYRAAQATSNQQCAVVNFPTAFASVPKVFVSVDFNESAYRSDDGVWYLRDPTTGELTEDISPARVWVKQVSPNAFKYCFVGGDGGANPGHRSITWLALLNDDPYPFYGIAAPYKEAGLVSGNGYTVDVATGCVQVPFKKSFTQVPTVIVNSNEQSESLDWSSSLTEISSIVTKISTHGFSICAGSPMDASTKWYYVAFSHGQETDAPTPAPVNPDPRTFSAPPAAPADTSTLAFAQFYHIDTPKITWGRGKPTLDDVLQNMDPAGLPDPWTSDDTPHAVEAKTDNRPECGWGEMESAYLVGWIWVPQGTESVWADFYTDVLSWVYVNDVLISDLDIPCCSYSRHSIAGSAFNTGEWNKFYMMGADACGGGGVGFKNMATQP